MKIEGPPRNPKDRVILWTAIFVAILLLMIPAGIMSQDSGLTQANLQGILWFQGIREATGGALDGFFSAVTELGIPLEISIFMAIVYWCVSREAGMLMLLSNYWGGLGSDFLKTTFHVYRGFTISDKVTPVASAVRVPLGYSFPSGHAFNGVTTYGVGGMAAKGRSRLLAFALLTVAVLIAVSRVYCGVHFPGDIIVGALMGVVVVGWMRRLLAYVDARPDDRTLTRRRELLVALAFVALAVAIFIYGAVFPYPEDLALLDITKQHPDSSINGSSCMATAFTMIGCSVGWLMARRQESFTTETSLPHKLLRLAVGVPVVWFLQSKVMYLIPGGLGRLLGFGPRPHWLRGVHPRALAQNLHGL